MKLEIKSKINRNLQIILTNIVVGLIAQTTLMKNWIAYLDQITGLCA